MEHKKMKTQQERILNLLAARGGNWVSLPEILDLKISQYSSRVHELRCKGHLIENRSEWVNGQRHSWFRLIPPASTASTSVIGSIDITGEEAPRCP